MNDFQVEVPPELELGHTDMMDLDYKIPSILDEFKSKLGLNFEKDNKNEKP